jgi:hypothetical protein
VFSFTECSSNESFLTDGPHSEEEAAMRRVADGRLELDRLR